MPIRCIFISVIHSRLCKEASGKKCATTAPSKSNATKYLRLALQEVWRTTIHVQRVCCSGLQRGELPSRTLNVARKYSDLPLPLIMPSIESRIGDCNCERITENGLFSSECPKRSFCSFRSFHRSLCCLWIYALSSLRTWRAWGRSFSSPPSRRGCATSLQYSLQMPSRMPHLRQQE